MKLPSVSSRRTVQALASLVLRYPDDDLIAVLPTLLPSARALPASLRGPAEDALLALCAVPAEQLSVHFVQTFDLNRRCSPYLTYFAHGDTRRRGVALLRFKDVYRTHGAVPVDDELPDHLAVVCEFGATVDLLAAEALLLDHRAGLELLRMALTEAGSPYAGILIALCHTLPPLRGDERDAVARLASDGPPMEEVGTGPDGYGGDLPAPTTGHAPTAGTAPVFVSVADLVSASSGLTRTKERS